MDKKVFISHSQKDKAIADIICDALEKESIGCWIAPRDIPYGNDWAGEITKAIESCALFVFILSEHSNASRQCPKEISIADNLGVPIICIKTDETEMNPGFKYHLSLQQMLLLDVSAIKEQMASVVNAIRDKLYCNTKSDIEYKERYNIDEELNSKFDEVFGAQSEEEKKMTGRQSITDKLSELRIKNFVNSFLSGLDRLEQQKRKDDSLDTFQTGRLLLSPVSEEDSVLCGKHFSIPNMAGFKTLVFQVNKDIVDYSTRSRYYNCVLLKSIEDDELNCTTFFPSKPPKEGAHLVFLHISSKENKVFVNTGVFDENTVRISKKPMLIALQEAKVSDNTIQLSDVGYNVSEISLDDFSDNVQMPEEQWVEANITSAPIILIDPVAARPVLREVYYDANEKCVKARMKLTPHKSYFAFEIRNPASQNKGIPLTDFEQGEYYRKGTHGFPKDLLKAAEIFEKENSVEAKFQMSLIFKEAGDFHDDISYREYLLQAAEGGSECALVELALSSAFGEHTDVSIEKCIDMLQHKIDSEYSVGCFVLAFLLENESPRKAFEYYLHAAQNDYSPAIARLSCQDYNTLKNVSEEELFKNFIQSVDENNGLSEYCMGCACFYGYDMEIRKESGFNLIKNAAYLGDVEAKRLLSDVFVTTSE